MTAQRELGEKKIRDSNSYQKPKQNPNPRDSENKEMRAVDVDAIRFRGMTLASIYEAVAAPPTRGGEREDEETEPKYRLK